MDGLAEYVEKKLGVHVNVAEEPQLLMATFCPSTAAKGLSVKYVIQIPHASAMR